MPIDYTKDRRPKAAQGAGVSLSKVTLTKNSPTVSLSKQQGGSAGGELRVNLNWTSRPPSGGLFKRVASADIDLDLACLYELSNGRKGVVQALGNSFTSLYEGTPNWAGANAVVTLYPQGGAPIEIHLDEADPGARTCAIALLESTGTDLSVRREVQYIKGTQSALDAAYSWGMSWTKGRK